MPSTHIIRRQVLEVAVSGTESDGFALQRRLPELCEDGLTPALEQVFERSAPADEHWTIERLEVDAGSFSVDTIERDLVEALTRALEKLLRERALPGTPGVSDGPVRRRTPAQSVREAFVYFLRTGSLPWWFHLPAGQTLEEAVRASWNAAGQREGPSSNFIGETGEVIRSASARARLVRQFSASFLDMLLASLSRESASAVGEILARLGDRGPVSAVLQRFARALRQAALAAVAIGARPTPADLVAKCLDLLPGAEQQDLALLERAAQIWPEVRLRKRVAEARASPGPIAINKASARADPTAAPAKGAENTEPDARLDLQEGVFVRSAGVVLLHPFLPRFFTALGIAADDRLVQPERALGLLHFLATGQRVAPEYELLLAKLLCNVPYETPVDSRIELTAVEEEEAVSLLQTVVRYWDALGDISIDGLRGTFLVRPGKLSGRESDDLLQVERRSVDVLLDRLPWGFGMIQLPWMGRLLSVEWQ